MTCGLALPTTAQSSLAIACQGRQVLADCPSLLSFILDLAQVPSRMSRYGDLAQILHALEFTLSLSLYQYADGTMQYFVWHKVQEVVCHCLAAIFDLEGRKGIHSSLAAN